MPKGKRRDPDNLPPFKSTTFHIPGQINTKNMSSSYQKSESQTTWARRSAAQGEKRKRDAAEAEAADLPSVPSGSKTIILHPGSGTLRIGRATDYAPKELPMALARRRITELNGAASNGSEARNGVNGKGKEREQAGGEMEVDEAQPLDEVDHQIASLRSHLQYRTEALHLRSFPAGPSLVSNYNSEVRPTKIKDFNDPFRVEWLGSDAESVVIGGAVDLVPGEEDWEIGRPLDGREFNRAYKSEEGALGDVQIIIEHALKELLGIDPREIPEYSVILVIPDAASHSYLRAFSNLLLAKMGFKQLSLQQETLGATFGAGLSAACVVDVGATRTSIACVEDGTVISDTRQSLAYGGNDLTRWLGELLKRSEFPYATLNLQDAMDLKLLQGLKEKVTTLNEQQVGVNVHDFWVRRPGKETLKFDFKVFDESILCPMGLFDPKVFKIEKVAGERQGQCAGDDGEVSLSLDPPTAAMLLSTVHLRPVYVPPPASLAPAPPPSASASDAGLLTPQPDGPMSTATEPFPPQSAATSAVSSPEKNVAAPSVGENGLSATPGASDVQPTPTPPFDVQLEASRTPLDFAILTSLLSSNGAVPSEDKIKKFAGTILVVGGGSLIRGLHSALSSRITPLLSARFPNLAAGGGVSVIGAPREVDPRLLVWKGISVLARLESVNETWVSKEEWDVAGMRAVKDRSLFL